MEDVAAHGGVLLPVMGSGSSAADETIDELFPRLDRCKASADDQEGWVVGAVTDDDAQLRIGPEFAAEEAVP